MTPAGRRRLWLGIGLLAVAIACLLSGIFPQAPLGRALERRLKASLGPGARVGRLHVVPGRRYVELEDLHLETEAYALDVPRASATVSTATLLGRGIDLETLEIRSPRLVVRSVPATSDGRRPEAAPGPTKTPPAAPSAPLTLRSLSLTDGTVVYQPGAAGASLALDDIDITGSVGDGVLAIRVASGSVGTASPFPFGP